MRSFAVLGYLAALATAGKMMFLLNEDDIAAMEYVFSVSQWDAGCTSGICDYAFNVTGASFQNGNFPVPAFNASCTGSGEGAPYALCAVTDGGSPDRLVKAQLLPANASEPGAHLAVSYRFDDVNMPDMVWNYTGSTVQEYNRGGDKGLLAFDVAISEVYAFA